jgi:hypothetical protein
VCQFGEYLRDNLLRFVEFKSPTTVVRNIDELNLAAAAAARARAEYGGWRDGLRDTFQQYLSMVNGVEFEDLRIQLTNLISFQQEAIGKVESGREENTTDS